MSNDIRVLVAWGLMVVGFGIGYGLGYECDAPEWARWGMSLVLGHLFWIQAWLATENRRGKK